MTLTLAQLQVIWNEESDYIVTVNPSAPGENFNGQPIVFHGYCRMQAARAYKDGAISAAKRMREHVQNYTCAQCNNFSEPLILGGKLERALCTDCTEIKMAQPSDHDYPEYRE